MELEDGQCPSGMSLQRWKLMEAPSLARAWLFLVFGRVDTDDIHADRVRTGHPIADRRSPTSPTNNTRHSDICDRSRSDTPCGPTSPD